MNTVAHGARPVPSAGTMPGAARKILAICGSGFALSSEGREAPEAGTKITRISGRFIALTMGLVFERVVFFCRACSNKKRSARRSLDRSFGVRAADKTYPS